jgi:hypothetical protein
MKRALVALIAGTILSGLAAAYATASQRIGADESAPAEGKAKVAAPD